MSECICKPCVNCRAGGKEADYRCNVCEGSGIAVDLKCPQHGNLPPRGED